ncbi:MAG: endonuclease/exonuclease/phosphatase family protein, partial [Anaerolineae bacterium]|nr:endonuclease/exonuclease/phosphatase family protein [Anaerolineae bacterium]
PPLLRGFRGMGLGLLLLGAFLAALPVIQTQRRIPWAGGRASGTVGGTLIVAALTLYVSVVVRPPVITAVQNVDYVRVGTYNLHNGFSEFFDFNLEELAHTIQQSGAAVVLLQQVDAGRMTSFGVDESLWLARRLKMDRRFFATNEGLQGLAVLSKVPIAEAGGSLLTSISTQTGVQWVKILPDSGELTVYNTWLGFLLETGDGRSIVEQEQDQRTQLDEIFSIISARHPNVNRERILVGGTFNNTSTSDLIARMRAASFSDPFAGVPLELAATLIRTDLQARVDYLWLRNPLLLCGNGRMDTLASDHRMIFSEILLNSQAECPG